MFPIDDEVHGWFVKMCQDFANIQLVVEDNGSSESVQIQFPKELEELFHYKKQFATIHYMGDLRNKLNEFEYFEVRFYVGALENAGVLDIVEARGSMRKKEWNKGGENEYYAYTGIVPYYEFERYVMPVLKDIELRFQQKLGDIYSALPVPPLPETVLDLPRLPKSKKKGSSQGKTGFR